MKRPKVKIEPHYYAPLQPGVVCRVDENGLTKFERPSYSTRDGQLVADWLNGYDHPLANMVPPERDKFMERLRSHPQYACGNQPTLERF